MNSLNRISSEQIALLVSLMALIIAFWRGKLSRFPLIEEIGRKRILQDIAARGPFDKSTIQNSTRNYMRPKCSNIDPSQEDEIRYALKIVKEDLFKVIDEFLDSDDSQKRHLLILADSGMGKTSFVLNYFAYNYQRPRKKQHKISIVPLGSPDSDEYISAIPNQSDTVLILDAFDEDVRAIEDYAVRIQSLMDVCKKFKKIVITCRSQFFPKDEEIPKETGVIRFGARTAGEKHVFEFWRLYLVPFDDHEIKRYISSIFPFWKPNLRRRALITAQSVKYLSVRPMLLSYLPKLLTDASSNHSIPSIYEAMIDAWLERELTCPRFMVH